MTKPLEAKTDGTMNKKDYYNFGEEDCEDFDHYDSYEGFYDILDFSHINEDRKNMTKNKAPTNTLYEVFKVPDVAADLLKQGIAGLEAMEKKGQDEAVATTMLPAKIYDKEEWEALGFTFGDPDPKDPLWAPATMPKGWSRKGSNNPMWTNLIDARGNCRGQFFYKASFWDRDTLMHGPYRRYIAAPDYDREIAKDHEACTVLDRVTDSVIFRTAIHPYSYEDKWARAEAEAWLKENFPDHDDPAAYWTL